MFSDYRNNIKRLNFFADILLTICAFFSASLVVSWITPPELVKADGRLLFFILPLWSILLLSSGNCYSYTYKPLHKIVLGILYPLNVGFIFIGIFYFFLNYKKVDWMILLIFLSLNLIFLVGLRKIINALFLYLSTKEVGMKKILLVGSGQMAKDFIKDVLTHPEWRLKIVGALDWEENLKGRRYLNVPLIGTLNSLPAILKNNQIDCVVFATPPQFINHVRDSVLLCEKMGVPIKMIADYFSFGSSLKKKKWADKKPVISLSNEIKGSEYLFLKDIFDRVLALIGILALSPVMLITALLVKLTSPGPVIFKQKRCGLNNKRFTFYKFRTMVKNAEELKKNLLDRNEMDGAAFKIKNDPRITWVGKYLRKLSLDELPQLFNVLLGHMSLVGPRPPLSQEVSRYEDWQRRRLSVKPGVTCLWQISGRNEIGFKQWMEMDLKYIDNWSLGLDLKILFKTIPAVILTRGAR